MQSNTYNIVLRQMLVSYVKNNDWEGMADYLDNLSNAQFRLAGSYLSTDILRTLSSNCYWACFLCLVKRNPKAYLMTFLKAAVLNYKDGRLEFNDSSFLEFAHFTAELKHSIDERKSIQTLLPILKTPGEVEFLFKAFEIEETERKVSYLMNVETMVCYYVLFNNLRQCEHNEDYLTQCCLTLIRKGTRYAYNMVSILKSYFDLPKVKGQFSLKMNSFELSRFEHGYEAFKDKMSSI